MATERLDRIALTRIQELEDSLDEQAVVIILRTEERDEWMARAKVLEAQLALLRQDRAYEVA